MKRESRSLRLGSIATLAVSLVALAALPTAAGSRDTTQQSAKQFATVGVVTTLDFRAAVVAQRLSGGSMPTAEVRVGLARRVGARWRELGEKRLDETFFWRPVTGPRAVCRLEIETAGPATSFRPTVTVRLLQSPSLGCGRTYRIPLAR
jgi:hypothetical protein